MDYKANDIVVHATAGVSSVSEVKIMNYGAGDIRYYCLRPYFQDSQNNTLVVYVPESKASELIRPIISKNEAEELLNSMKDANTLWYNDGRERKEKFSSLYHSGDLNNVCIILKSLYLQQQKLAVDNRSLNLMDYDFLKKLKKEIIDELSVSLGCTRENIEERISNIVK